MSNAGREAGHVDVHWMEPALSNATSINGESFPRAFIYGCNYGCSDACYDGIRLEIGLEIQSAVPTAPRNENESGRATAARPLADDTSSAAVQNESVRDGRCRVSNAQASTHRAPGSS